MRITRIAVEGVGRFGVPTEVRGLGPGVNILAAGNEAGKSTLFRAVRACLFERHNTVNKEVRALATDGLSLPVTVTLGFEHAGEDYAVTKSFLRSQAARLTRGGVEIARGREADETVWELLGIEPGGGRSVDEAAFGILWVGQGQSFDVPEPSEAATTALNTAIQAEVGTLVGGERARAVLSSLREELARFVTDRGKAKAGGPLAEAEARLAALAADLAVAEGRRAVLDGQFADLAGRRSERGRLGDPAVAAETAAGLAAARQELKAGEGAAAALAPLEAAERAAAAVVEAAAGRLADLEARAARIDADRRREDELRAAAAGHEGEDETARRAMERARSEIAALDAEAERDEAAERALQRVAAAVSRAAGRAERVERQAALADLGERVIANAAALAANRATAAAVAALDDAEREASVLSARLAAAAPRVEVVLGPAGAGRVSLGDAVLSQGVVQAAVDPLTIRVGDLATVVVSPPPGAGAADQKKRQALQERMAALVAEAGVADGAALRAARAHRLSLEAEAAAIAAELAARRIQGTSPALAVEALRTEIAEIDTLVAEALAVANLAALPTADEVAERLDDLRRRREASRRRRQALDGEVQVATETLARLADARGRSAGALAEIRGRLDGDLAILPDEGRAVALASAAALLGTARAEHGVKAAALEDQRGKAPTTDDLERRRIRVSRLEAAVETQAARLAALDREIANLEGQIQSAGGDGLGEKVETLREERDLAERDVARQRARVAALQLLKDTVESAYQEQRDRLNAPLRRHLQPFLGDVFPAAELELGDGFTVAGLRRAGPAAEDFARLSAGTQEQIAVLVRLAMGAMIAERGQDVPIILDDALVFSDDDRIEQMFDALNRAGRIQQVIVLTCRLRAFAALGGRQLEIAAAPPGG